MFTTFFLYNSFRNFINKSLHLASLLYFFFSPYVLSPPFMLRFISSKCIVSILPLYLEHFSSLPLILFFSSYQTYLANKFSLFCYVISSCQNQSPHARGISSANKTHVNSSPWLTAGTERAVLMQIPQKMKTRERKRGIEGSKDANNKKRLGGIIFVKGEW